MKRAFIVQHVPFEGLGTYKPVLARAGWEICPCKAWSGEVEQVAIRRDDLLVVMGGPMGVYEADKYTFLRDELKLIERHIAAGGAVLGVCLGAQLTAAALGSRVYPGGRQEIGWSPLQLTEAGRASPLHHLAPELTQVMHWHGDTFDMPEGVVHLAATAAYQNQAFARGRNILALQFHAEVTEPILERWIAHGLDPKQAGIDVGQLRAAAVTWAARMETQAKLMLGEWLSGLPITA